VEEQEWPEMKSECCKDGEQRSDCDDRASESH